MEGLTVCWAVALEACSLSVGSSLRGRDALLLSGQLGLSSPPRDGEDEVLEKLLETFSQGH